jgi:hypothetical protein
LSQITEVPASSGAAKTGPFVGVDGMTVDGGDLYLAEGQGREYSLDKFDASSGGFLSQFPLAPSSFGYLNQAVAVGHGTSETEVYVTGDEVVGASEGVVAVFDASGMFQGVWKGADTPSGGFGCFECAGPAGVAVDESGAVGDWASGDVYVADTEHAVVDVFEPVAGGGEKYVTQIAGPEPPTTLFARTFAVAVNQSNGEVLISDGEGTNPGKSVDVFKPAPLTGQYEFVGKLTGTPNGPFGFVVGIASDATTGNVFVAASNGKVDEFSSSNAYLGRITGEETPAGNLDSRSVAVDSATHRVFVGERGLVDVFGPDLVIPDVTTEPATSVASESATLHGTVNPDSEGAATCQFEWGTTSEFGHVASCSAGVPDGSSPVAVQAALSGLHSDRTYFFRLQASNKNGTNPGNQGQQFMTPGPGLDGESVSNVTASSASLNASVNPHDTPTSYYFQYGTSTAYGTDVPDSPGVGIGSGEGDVEVSNHLQGLLASIVYHYRVVAVSELAPGVVESFPGPDQTFVTQTVSSGGSVLPDGRSWEMVSPPDKSGAQIYAIGQYSGNGADIQASATGGSITYITDSPTESKAQGYSNLLQVFSVRGIDGWGSQDIAVPHDKGTGFSINLGAEYRFFSEDLSLGVVQPFGGFVPSLSAEASESTAYLRTDYLYGSSTEQCSSGCYRPFVTGAPGFANVPEGTMFGEEKKGECTGVEKVLCGPQFAGGTPNLSHVVLFSYVALTSTPLVEGGGLYEWSKGRLVLVSVLPGPEQEASRSPHLGSDQGGIMPGNGANARHAISNDGLRIFWTASGGLYMRDVPRGETLLVSNETDFEDASADGSRVFFGGKMCEIELNEATNKLECVVTKLGDHVVGTSDDGSWVYFTTGDVLNVLHEGVAKVVAVLSPADEPDWNTTDIDKQPLRVSPDGQWLAFMSQRDLTGYDTRDALTGEPDEEVYLYNAISGRVKCASCNPSGARPVGTPYSQGGGESLHEGSGKIWAASYTLASDIPGWTPIAGSVARYQSRYLSDDGRLFFNSNDGLVPQDVNGTWDAYEYEPPGVGDCSTDSVTFSEHSGGCVGLISSGESGEESAFLDASATGGDVFFLTSARLSGRDLDTAIDVYDAHECSVDAPCFPVLPVSPPVCDTGDACKAAPTPQPAVFGSPSSAMFSGAGNVTSAASRPVVASKGLTRAQKLARALRACRKKRGKRRAVCVRQARARYASKTRRVTASKRGRG